jgi:hypothetical protein
MSAHDLSDAVLLATGVTAIRRKAVLGDVHVPSIRSTPVAQLLSNVVRARSYLLLLFPRVILDQRSSSSSTSSMSRRVAA